MTTVKERVASEAERLDGWAPGWEDDIDLTLLDVQSAYCCTYAQLSLKSVYNAENPATPYEQMVAYFGVGSHISQAARGVLSLKQTVRGRYKQYEELTEAWREEIIKRRIAKAPELYSEPQLREGALAAV